MNQIITEMVTGLNTAGMWIVFGTHFWAFGSVLFFLTLAIRGLFVYKESYQLTIRLTIVVFCFGGELAMTHFPYVFTVHIFNIAFAIAGALLGRWSAEAWAGHQQRVRRESRLPNSIFERYHKGRDEGDPAEVVMD